MPGTKTPEKSEGAGPPQIIGRVHVAPQPVKFGGPKLELQDELREWPIESILQHSEMIVQLLDKQQVQSDPHRKLQNNRFRIHLKGGVKNATRMLFDGKEVVMSDGRWETDLLIEPGNNKFTVFLYDDQKRFSNYTVDVQLLDFRRSGENYATAPPIIVPEVPRSDDLVLDVGVSYASYKLERTDGTSRSGTLDFAASVSGDYWLSDKKPIWRDLAVHASGDVHMYGVLNSATTPLIYMMRFGPKGRFFFFDETLTPSISLTAGYFYYYTSDPVGDIIGFGGLYSLVDVDFPITQDIGVMAEAGFSLVPQRENTSRMVDMGGSLYYAFSPGTRFRVGITYRPYKIIPLIGIPAVTHRYLYYTIAFAMDL
jgi:hypothetical protein